MELLLVYKSILIGGAFAMLFALERLYPLASVRHRFAEVVKNLALAAFNLLLSPIIVIPITIFAAGHAFTWRPEWWQGPLGLAIDILLLDCWIYFWHRLNHEWQLLWRFHEVHHLDEALDTTTALRFHFGEVAISSLVRAAVMILLNVPLISVLIFEVAVALAALFQHSNVRLPKQVETLLARIIVTPSLHWVHHHAERMDTDSNYGTIFSFWDVLFRSKSRTARTPDMKIGVAEQRDVKLLHLLLRPFSRQ